MQVTGLVFVTHDVDADAREEWCRWYDVEHLPEYVALPGVMGARRYVATPELHALRGPNPAYQFADGRSTYLTVYLLSDEDVAATWQGMLAATRRWNDEGRRFDPDRAVARHVELFRFDWALAAPGVTTTAAAVPHMRQVGVQVALGSVSDEAMRPVVAQWYRTIHAPDMLDVAGVVGAARFVAADEPARHLVLFALGDEPADVMTAVRAAVPAWRAAGRTPSPGGASLSVFNGPFRALAPLGR